MSIPDHVCADIYLNLVTLSGNDLSPLGFIGGPRTEETALQEWQDGVEIIYRLLQCGLIEFTEYADHDAPVIREPIELAQALASQNPFDDTQWILDQEMPHWYIPLLSLTEAGERLVQRYEARGGFDSVWAIFSEEIEAVFTAANVPWMDTPLIACNLQDNAPDRHKGSNKPWWRSLTNFSRLTS